MAGTGGKSDAPLIRELIQAPQEFEFFQAVRIIERYVLERFGETRVAVGGDGVFNREAVRFRAIASLCFPPGQISSVKMLEDEDSETAGGEKQPFVMTVPFMGLTGPGGALPQHYTSMIIDRVHLRNKDYAMQEFFDLFNHRIISLFYRAWEKYRFPIAYEQSMQDDPRQNDLFTRCLFSLVGMGSDCQRERFSFDDQCILTYGGLFATVTRNVVSLRQVVSDFSGLSTTVEQFVGQWLMLAPETQSCFPSAGTPFGQNLELGQSAVVGTAAWDIQSRIRVVLGPVDWRDFVSLLPDSPRLMALQEMIRLYIGIHLDFDIQVVLKQDEVPDLRLREEAGYEPRLGWTTWLPSAGQRIGDAKDAVFRF